jgi:Ca2+-transporting ATPase
MGSQEIPEAILSYARTMAFVVLAASQLFYSLTMRSTTKSIFQIGLFTNKALIGAIIAGFFLQLAVISVPFLASAFKVRKLSAFDWGLVIAFALVPLIINELIKVWLRQQETRQ